MKKILCMLIVVLFLLGISACSNGDSFHLLQINKIGDQNVTFMDDKYIVSDDADAYDLYTYSEKENLKEPEEEYPKTQYQEVCTIKGDWNQFESVGWERNRLYTLPNYDSVKNGTRTYFSFTYYTAYSYGEYYNDPDYKDVNHTESYLQAQSDRAIRFAGESLQDDEMVVESKQSDFKKMEVDGREIHYIVTEYGEFGDLMIQIDTYEQRSEDSAFCISIENSFPIPEDDGGPTIDYEKSIKDAYSMLSFTNDYKSVTAGSPAARKTILSPSGQIRCTENYSDISYYQLGRTDMTFSNDEAQITLELLSDTEERASQSILRTKDYKEDYYDYYVFPEEMKPIEFEGQKFLMAEMIYDDKDDDVGFKDCYFLTMIEDSVFKITYSEFKQESVKGEDLDEEKVLSEVMKNITLESASNEKTDSSYKNIEKQISKCWSGVSYESEYAFFMNEDETYAGYIRRPTGELAQIYVGDLQETEKEITVSGRTYNAKEYVITDEKFGSISVEAFEMTGKLWIYNEKDERLFSLDPSGAEGFTKYLN